MVGLVVQSLESSALAVIHKAEEPAWRGHEAERY
jgi:hypothetical protein